VSTEPIWGIPAYLSHQAILRVMNMRIMSILGLSAALVAYIHAAGAATTTNAKDYSGAMCVASGGNGLTVDNRGAILNTGADSSVVVCPVVRDLNRISSVQVQIFRNEFPIFCSLSTVRSDATIQAKQVLSVPGGPVGKAQLNFAGQSAPSTGKGSYVLQCNLPPLTTDAAGILMYRVVESN
jgi:hypothetical protein